MKSKMPVVKLAVLSIALMLGAMAGLNRVGARWAVDSMRLL